MDLCVDFQMELKNIHIYSGYSIEVQQYSLEFGTMNKLRMIISLVGTKMKDTPGTFHSDHLLLVNHLEFHLIRQEEAFRMTKRPTATSPGATHQ